MLSSLSLFVATLEQVFESRKRTSVEWGKGLTLEEYLDRDVVGEGEEFGKDGKLVTWYVYSNFEVYKNEAGSNAYIGRVLAPRDDPTTLDFFSSCETYVAIVPTHLEGK